MDELTFDPNLTANSDSTTEVEGYEEHVEEVKKAYPEQDWRTPAQVEAEEQTQPEQQPTAQSPDQVTEVATQVATQVGEQLGLPSQPIGLPLDENYQPEVLPSEDNLSYGAKEEDFTKNKFAQYIDPRTGQVPIQVLQAAGVSDDLIQLTRAWNDYLPEEKEMWDEFDANGGNDNLENVYNTFMRIRNTPHLLARYDRNGDGEFTMSDWYDMAKYNAEVGMTPEQERIDTANWLNDLQNKHFGQRVAAFFGHEPMSRYIHQRRKGVLGPRDDLDGEQMRASALAGFQVTAESILSAPEKIQAGLEAAANDDDPDTWFDWNASETHDASFDDMVLGHKNPLSTGFAINNPVNRVWSDSTMFELGRYSPAIGLAFALPGSLTAIGSGGAGWTAKGVGIAGLHTAKAFGVTWATETIPTNLFVDMNNSAMKVFHGDNKAFQQLAAKHPEMYVDGVQMSHGYETPFSRKLEFMRQEMTWDAGGLLVGNILMRGVGHGITALSEKNFKQITTSTKPNIRKPLDVKDIVLKRKQVADDVLDAAQDQTKMGAEGPSSKWNDWSSTDGELDSWYGDFKNQKTVSGQRSAGIRSNAYDITKQVNELKNQVGIEGGTVDELFTPVERADFAKNGIPDPWFTRQADELASNADFAADLNRLNPLDRNLGNLAEDQLKNIQEVLGRDAASLEPREFWGDAFVDTPIKAGEVLDDVKKFVIKNLQIQDAVNNSLLKRLRDYADAAGEQLGKGDIFAKGGPMRNVARNLSMGLSQVKKTQFTWDLAAKRMKETGGELTKEMVEEINATVAQRSRQLTKESDDGVRLMMQLMEGSDDLELAEAILDVFKVSNDIHNWKDFDGWMRQKISGGEFNGKVKTGVLIHELQGVMVNSILSGPKTPLRAILGTTTNAYLNAINEAAGATLRAPFTNDVASRMASVAKLKGMFELIPEAFTVFRKNLKAKFNADLSDIRTRYSEAPTGHDQNWNLFGKWTEQNGTIGDKAAFYIANIARNLNNNKLLSWSPRALAATDDTFKWLLARARSKEIGMRQALEVAADTHTKFSPELMKKAEDINYKNLLDADGNLDLSQDSWLNKQFKEVTLTSELKGFSAKLDELFNSTPLIKPFYLFARTGVNGLNLSFKSTPLLGALHKESIDILRHTGDDFTPLFKYGIENANDLANARNLFAGRQAVGAATVMGVSGMYMAGQLTGSGPADQKLKQQWINAGWKPNHIYVGDVGFDYTAMEPYNVIWSAIADIGDNMELMGSEWAEQRLQAVAFVLGRGLTNKTYMSGLDQMMQVIQMKPGALNRTGANILNNSVPLAGLRNEFGKWANPHMKELNSDMWTSIRNRNQATEFLAQQPLPEKSDILNGKPIRNWNIIGRSFNAISPVQLDIRNDTPGRRLLMDSNYDLKSTTYAYGGYSFTKDAHVRSHFQNAIGTVPVTVGFKKFANVEEALNHLASRDDVKNSMAQMKADGKNPANWDLDPNQYPHNTLIDNLMNQARAKAWAKINQEDHPAFPDVQKLKAEKDGLTTRQRNSRQEILEFNYPSRQVEQFPKN